MDYKQDEPSISPAPSRIKKYGRYVRIDTSAQHQTKRRAMQPEDVYGRFRQSIPQAEQAGHGSVRRVALDVGGKYSKSVGSTIRVAREKTPLSTSIAHQAALFAVHQASATRQDLLAEQFPDAYGTQAAQSRKFSRGQKVFYGLGCLVFFLAVAVSLQGILVNHQAKEKLGVLGAQTQRPDEYGVPEGSGDEPAEAEVPKAALSAYKSSPELPRYLRIPELGVFARIKHTGVTNDGAIDAPANINDVSWYSQSAKPGDEIGTSLLLGHVSGWTAPGVFKKINQLKPGMRFEVEKGNGEKITYEVTRGESVPLDGLNMGKVLTPEVQGEHDLKLMTCSGRFNRQADHFEERYIVYAKIVR